MDRGYSKANRGAATTGTRKPTRTEKGLELFRSRGEEIARAGYSRYSVPSRSRAGEHHVVDLLTGFCPCGDRVYGRSESCAHAVAASVKAAKVWAERQVA